MPTLDVRKHPGKEQIRGALRYNPKALLEADELALPLPHEGRVVVYADSDEDAVAVATRLREQGYKNVATIDGGFKAYRDADLPVEQLTQEQPVPGEEGAGIPRI